MIARRVLVKYRSMALDEQKKTLAVQATAQKKSRLARTKRLLRVVPLSGIELLTYALRVRCSTN